MRLGNSHKHRLAEERARSEHSAYTECPAAMEKAYEAALERTRQQLAEQREELARHARDGAINQPENACGGLLGALVEAPDQHVYIRAMISWRCCTAFGESVSTKVSKRSRLTARIWSTMISFALPLTVTRNRNGQFRSLVVIGQTTAIAA